MWGEESTDITSVLCVRDEVSLYHKHLDGQKKKTGDTIEEPNTDTAWSHTLHSIHPEHNKIVYKNKSVNIITSPIRRMQHCVMYTAACIAIKDIESNCLHFQICLLIHSGQHLMDTCIDEG